VTCYILYMARARKINRGIGLYPQDWERAKRNLEPDEHLIELIEKALILECEIREGKRRRPMAMTLLMAAEEEPQEQQIRRPMSTL